MLTDKQTNTQTDTTENNATLAARVVKEIEQFEQSSISVTFISLVVVYHCRALDYASLLVRPCCDQLFLSSHSRLTDIFCYTLLSLRLSYMIWSDISQVSHFQSPLKYQRPRFCHFPHGFTYRNLHVLFARLPGDRLLYFCP